MGPRDAAVVELGAIGAGCRHPGASPTRPRRSRSTASARASGRPIHWTTCRNTAISATGHSTSRRTTTNTPGYDAALDRYGVGSGLQRERQHAVVVRRRVLVAAQRVDRRARARRPGGACPRAPRTRWPRSSGCGPTLSICSTKRSHCFSNALERSRISCDVRLSWKLSTAWRITASTANSVSGEQNTTLLRSASSRRSGPAPG